MLANESPGAPPAAVLPTPAPGPAPVPLPAAAPSPDLGATREVRFAVVMYGGVSLCIYINGIAQELLHLVRATASDATGSLRYTDEQLTRGERVYRRLGRLLSDERDVGTDVAPDAPVRTRFSVDILSGTSAGGINSIFLAKALANDEDMQQLKQLWMTEGDLAKLINDGGSTAGTTLQRPTSPQALLNGQRMYQKLVAAFDGMDDQVGAGDGLPERPPLVPELDLFVTTTDIAGVPLPLRLADGVVHERRHRGVFHFRFKSDGGAAAEVNDFGRAYNPFLAFAARCTSSFPFAFEPMRLTDIDPVLDTLDAHRGRAQGRSTDARWKPFLERFITPEGTAQVKPEVRSFGDGGYLDNKPFSYASESLLRRESGVPVDRKLIYIEPAPEHPERDPARTDRPDAIENVMAATVGLPRYETIREDLERVMARNRLTERVRTITQALEEDLPGSAGRQVMEKPTEWGKRYLAEMVADFGLGYGSYHRLRVASTTDWLAKIVSRAAMFPDGSDMVLAVRYLVRAWREKHYTPFDRSGNAVRESENQFLLNYDLSFRIRRVGYLLGKVNWLHGYDWQVQSAMRQITGMIGKPGTETADPVAALAAREMTADEKAEFRAALGELKREFYPVFTAMQRAEEQMARTGEKNPFWKEVKDLDLQAPVLAWLLTLSGEEREKEAHLMLSAGTREQQLADFASRVQAQILAAREPASVKVDALLNPAKAPPEASPARQLARRVLWHYYQHYGDYDTVSFPIIYSTDAGEQDTVDIVRISPEDATFIFDEKTDPLGRRKLAGTSLFNFGGFLQDTWRANDILWGRLDGAERLICALLPHKDDEKFRNELLEEASLAIMQDEFKDVTRKEVSRLMSESLVSVAAGRSPESAVSRLAGRIGNQALPRQLEAVFGDCLDEKQLLAYFSEAYEVNRDLEPQTALNALARGSRVVGQILEGLTERHTQEGKRVRWLTRVASWFWGLVQVAVPRSVPSLLFDHWLGLFYTLAVLMMVVGVFAGGVVMGWGVRILGAALGAHLVVLLFRDFMRRRGVVAAVLGAVAAGAGLFLLISWGWWLSTRRITPDRLAFFRGRIGLERWTGDYTVQALCFVLGGLILLAGVWPLLRRPWDRFLPGGYRQPMLATEFVENAEGLARLNHGRIVPPAAPAPAPGSPPPSAAEVELERRMARIRPRQHKVPRIVMKGVYVDYLFIAAYWILFLLLADRLVGMAGVPARGWRDPLLLAGLGAGLTATAAALLDLVENGRIHEAFTAGRGREEDWMALGIRWAAGWKWALAFITVILLSPLFFAAGERPLQILGGGWVVIGVAGLGAVMRRPRLLEWVFPLLGAGLLAAGFLLGG
jgi:patatin-related protein